MAPTVVCFMSINSFGIFEHHRKCAHFRDYVRKRPTRHPVRDVPRLVGAMAGFFLGKNNNPTTMAAFQKSKIFETKKSVRFFMNRMQRNFQLRSVENRKCYGNNYDFRTPRKCNAFSLNPCLPTIIVVGRILYKFTLHFGKLFISLNITKNKMDKNRALLTASIVFGLIAIFHFARAVLQLDVLVSDFPIPVYFSYLAAIIIGYLAWMMYGASKA